jgi:hypothetical protein
VWWLPPLTLTLLTIKIFFYSSSYTWGPRVSSHPPLFNPIGSNASPDLHSSPLLCSALLLSPRCRDRSLPPRKVAASGRGAAGPHGCRRGIGHRQMYRYFPSLPRGNRCARSGESRRWMRGWKRSSYRWGLREAEWESLIRRGQIRVGLETFFCLWALKDKVRVEKRGRLELP